MSSSTTANKKTETLSASEIMDEASKIPSSAVSKPDSNMDASAGQDGSIKPSFPALNPSNLGGVLDETRSIRVPPHRYTPLKENWEGIVKPIVEHMKLMVRMNTKTRCVEIKTSPYTTEPGALQRAEDFVKAFTLGFDLSDAIAILRLDDLYIETFEVTDVKPLKGDHLSRAIGRMAGANGKTRFAIENATRTRIVVADSKVHILGAFANIQIARDAICALILGSPPGKVYNNMKTIAARMSQRS